MIGTCAPIAALYADTITAEPSTPSAPLLIVASDAKITTLLPLTVAVTAIIPQSVRGIRKLKIPSSTNRAILEIGSRGSCDVGDIYKLLKANTTL